MQEAGESATEAEEQAKEDEDDMSRRRNSEPFELLEEG